VVVMIGLMFAFLRRLATRVRLFRYRRHVRSGVDLHIGTGTKIWAPVDVDIGDHVYLGKHVHIEANASIGSYVMLANNVALVGRHDHDIRAIGVPVRFGHWVGSKNYPSPFKEERVVIEDDVWLGYGSIVLTGVTIGRGAIVAAGSLISRDVERYSIVGGNPAKVIGRRFLREQDIARHEHLLAGGKFYSSERGFDFFTIERNEGA